MTVIEAEFALNQLGMGVVYCEEVGDLEGLYAISDEANQIASLRPELSERAEALFSAAQDCLTCLEPSF